MTYEYVSRNKTKEAKSFFIEKVKKIMNESKELFAMFVMLVGSSKRNLVLVSRCK